MVLDTPSESIRCAHAKRYAHSGDGRGRSANPTLILTPDEGDCNPEEILAAFGRRCLPCLRGVCYDPGMDGEYRWGVSLAGEAAVLAVCAPILYFPSRFPSWAPVVAIAVLLAAWGWRRWWCGRWWTRTPGDWALLVLFGVMLPVSVWAAPPPLRATSALPHLLILVWNLCLFGMVVTYNSHSRRLGEWLLAGLALGTLAGALAAPLGMDWLYKFPGLEIAAYIPAPLRGATAGARPGFHPNMVAGTLLYALPLLLALSVGSVRRQGRALFELRGVRGLVWVTAILACGVLFLTQSRGGLLGLGVACGVMLLVQRRWGRWVLVIAAVAILIGLPYFSTPVLEAISDAPPGELLGGTSTLGFRQRMWSQALAAIQDYPFTGVGLGTFADLMWSFYPIAVYATDDIGHAHNFFLQTALDVGIPGLVMVLAFYLTAFAQVVFVWRRGDFLNRVLATGFLGSLVGQSVFSQLDAVALGTKYNLFFWYLFALIFGAANLAAVTMQAASAGRVEDGRRAVQAGGERLAREVVEEPFVGVGD